MKPPPEMTIEHVTERLRGSHRLGDYEARAIEDRYRVEAGDLADAERYLRWLVARGHVTESQAEALLQGRSARVMPAAAPAPPAEAGDDTLRAVIVAPAAQARAPRPALPVVAAAPPEPPVPLVAAAVPPAAEGPASAAESDITVELVALTALTERFTVAPPATSPPPAIAPSSTNIWLYLFLGGLGMLIVQFAGWLLAQILSRVL